MANIPLKDIEFPGLGDRYTIPQVDNTLTQTGEAADAKATGDEISDLNNQIKGISIVENVYQGGLQNGNLSIGNLAFTDVSTIIRTIADEDRKNILVPANKTVYFTCNSGYKYAYQFYNKSGGASLENFTWHTDETANVTETVDSYLVLMVAKTDGSDISISEIENLFVSFSDYIVSKEIDAVNERVDAISSVETVTLPFDFDIGVNVYKNGKKYWTDFVPQSKALNDPNGVTVFLDPNGDNTNDGLTVSTPKKTFASALSVENIQTLILLSGTYVAGTHFSIGGFQITQALNMIGIGDVVVDNADSNHCLMAYRTIYCENIHFKNGGRAFESNLATEDRYAVFYKCKFSDSKATNGLSVMGGTCYVVECEAYNNAYDGFNYHAKDSLVNKAIEINCKSYGNGTVDLDESDGQSSNATTTHDGSYIVRVNGEYYACHGGVVADKQSSSANYACSSGVSTITDEANYPDRMSNYWCSYGNMWLYDCISFGSKYDTAVVNGGTITSDTVYSNSYS